MQIQAVNNAPNFQANYLRTAQQAVKYGSHPASSKIDIYSIDSRDKDLIEKLLVKTDLKPNRKDAAAVKEKNNINDTIRYILNKALHLDEKSNDGVYIAVKNNKHLTGLLDFTNGSSPVLKNLISWRGNKDEATRSNLFEEFLRYIEKANNNRNWYSKVDITAYSEPKTKGTRWLKENGFVLPEGSKASVRERLVMEDDVIASSRQKVEERLEAAGLKVNKNLKHSQVELKNLDL